MKNSGLRTTVLLILAVLITGSLYGVYGLTSTNAANKIDAVASATTVQPKPPAPSVKPPVVAPVQPVQPVPLPIPVAPALGPVLPTVKETTLSLFVFNKAVDITGSPIIQSTDGRLMLPLRKVGEALGYTVKWDNLIKAGVLQKTTETVVVKYNSPNYMWGASSRELSRKPELYMNRIYVPLDFITDNSSYQLNQTAASISIDLSSVAAKQEITGEIEEITVFINGLGLEIEDNTKKSVMLYLTDATLITDYTTGASINSSKLGKGTKAIFTYTEIVGEGLNKYNVLSSMEIVELESPPSVETPAYNDDEDDEEDDEEDD